MHTRRPVTSFGLWGKNGTIRNDAYKSEDRQAHGGSTELIYYAQSNIYRDQQNLDKRYPHQFTWGSGHSNPCALPNPFIRRCHSAASCSIPQLNYSNGTIWIWVPFMCLPGFKNLGNDHAMWNKERLMENSRKQLWSLSHGCTDLKS